MLLASLLLSLPPIGAGHNLLMLSTTGSPYQRRWWEGGKHYLHRGYTVFSWTPGLEGYEREVAIEGGP